jgi:predicted amidohydrolase YtcJ
MAVFLVARQNAWAQARRPADGVITNARIYTVNARQPWAEAVAIRGKIVAVGRRDIGHYPEYD